MKIKEFIIVPTKNQDTTSCGTTYSDQKTGSAQDIVPQDDVPMIYSAQEVDSHPDHSAIAEGVSQIFRRKKGGAPTKGFRCTSGPRKGRIVAKPSTCFQKTDPNRSAAIRRKRQQKAKIAGKKLGITKRSGAGSKRLQGIQIKKKKGSQPKHGSSSRTGGRPLMKSKVIKPK
jgi:hypothetical protein